jgi:hypothetical protein
MFSTYYEENTVEERSVAYTATNKYINTPWMLNASHVDSLITTARIFRTNSGDANQIEACQRLSTSTKCRRQTCHFWWGDICGAFINESASPDTKQTKRFDGCALLSICLFSSSCCPMHSLWVYVTLVVSSLLTCWRIGGRRNSTRCLWVYL